MSPPSSVQRAPSPRIRTPSERYERHLKPGGEDPRIEGEALTVEEEAARALKQRLEAMGPVNMMALEEYNETAARHSFLETQRNDLLESIENTQASIKEIDDVSRVKQDGFVLRRRDLDEA